MNPPTLTEVIYKHTIGAVLCLLCCQIISQEIESSTTFTTQSCVIDFEMMRGAVQVLEALDRTTLTHEQKLLLLDALPFANEGSTPLCAFTLHETLTFQVSQSEPFVEHRVERFTPAGQGSQNWSLLDKNGRTPSNEDLDFYEIESNIKHRSLRRFPWELDLQIPWDTLHVEPTLENRREMIFAGHLKYGKNDSVSESHHFDIHLLIDVKSRQLQRLVLTLNEPVEPNALYRVDNYEIWQDWEFNAEVKRSIRKQSRLRIRGQSSTSNFMSESALRIDTFYCPRDENESGEDSNPCFEPW